MSDQGNIFGGDPSTQTQSEATSAPAESNPWADKLKGITNEAGEQKYADVDTALEALHASQRYIPELHNKLDSKEAELAELRQELARTKGYQDALQELQPAPQTQEQTPAPAGLDAEQATQLFEEMVAKREQAQVRQKNGQAVANALREKFKDKAEEAFVAKANELGMTAEAMNSLAQTSPSAVLALFGTTSTKTSTDVSAKTSIYQDPNTGPEEIRLERNKGQSVLSGSTSRDVRAEYEYNKELVAKIHSEGGSVEDLSDPKMYFKYFGN